ncbi:MAG: L-2-amino-thiazoline-4-carboxylic acid hydrolase [Acetobacteraceae bacterium]|jgi:hypothetical protein|nr:L-2-amino-thiazoline-4-carboxylic acid hydrolase [Acetobacteraceae bacterium]
MDAATLKRQLKAQMANRAMIYLEAYEALSSEVGAEQAEAILARAIYNRGRSVGDAFKRFAPDDLAGLRDAFIGGLPGGTEFFKPEVRRCDAEKLEIKFHDCPLKAAWLEAGVPEGKLAALCRIAGIIDNGTFEAAGFTIENRTWAPGEIGCCNLHITPGPKA